jgi:hypothetical protein
MIACYFLHCSDHTCLLRRLEPRMGCKHRRKNDNCGLANDEAKEDEKRGKL